MCRCLEQNQLTNRLQSSFVEVALPDGGEVSCFSHLACFPLLNSGLVGIHSAIGARLRTSFQNVASVQSQRASQSQQQAARPHCPGAVFVSAVGSVVTAGFSRTNRNFTGPVVRVRIAVRGSEKARLSVCCPQEQFVALISMPRKRINSG